MHWLHANFHMILLFRVHWQDISELLVLWETRVASVDSKEDVKESQDGCCRLKRTGKTENWKTCICLYKWWSLISLSSKKLKMIWTNKLLLLFAVKIIYNGCLGTWMDLFFFFFGACWKQHCFKPSNFFFFFPGETGTFMSVAWPHRDKTHM